MGTLTNNENPDEKTQMWHFIKVCTVCHDRNDLGQQYDYIWKICFCLFVSILYVPSSIFQL